MTSDPRERLALASQACASVLQQPPFPQILSSIGQYAEPAAAFHLLSQVTMHQSGDILPALCTSTEPDSQSGTVERALLMLAAQYAAPQVPSLPIADSVKELFAEEFELFANPTPAWVSAFRCDNVRFREMARVATLRRFPAGQFQWEATALPRSWLFETRQVFSLLRYVLFKLGGFSPLWELHLNELRKNRRMLLEKEGKLSYYRAAKSLERQPEVKGIMQVAWLFSESTAEISPHLAWLRTVPQSGGALVVDLGPAPEDSGFLTGSVERRKKYEEGSFRPRTGCLVWPRKELVAWADQHPELNI